MKAKLNRILSSALVVVLLFGAVAGLIPVRVNAAYIDADPLGKSLSKEKIWELAEDTCKYTFSSAEEMFNDEYKKGYLISVDYNKNDPEDISRYTLYVNRYTGFIYYVDNLTGQMLTSNPSNYPSIGVTVDGTLNSDLASQIIIYYSETTKNTSSKLVSSLDAARNAQISVEYIQNGFRVNYTLGDTVARYLLPGYILADKFEDELLKPMLEKFGDLMKPYVEGFVFEETGKYKGKKLKNAHNIFESNIHNPSDSANETVKSTYSVYYNGTMNLSAVQLYLDGMQEVINKTFTVANGNLKSPEYAEIQTLFQDIMQLYATGSKGYILRNLNAYEKGSDSYNNIKDKYYSFKNSETINTLEPIYEFTGTTNPQKEYTSKIFEKYINAYRMENADEFGNYEVYSFTEMYEDEDYCGYVDQTDPKPVFRCALEYSFNDDGSLSVRLPANSISFDETLYNLSSIEVLKYFGAANATKDGHIFFPDGSGAVLEYKDFYDPILKAVNSTSVSADIYGADNSYSPEVDPAKITGAYREQVSMPVFGVVGTENATSYTAMQYDVSSVTNGYFAIVETGASLAKLEFQTGAGSTASAFCTYSPYPSDKYDLSNTISVGGADYYTMVSDAKFNGSYVTRYVMLTDKTIGEKILAEKKIGYYESSYSGMAAYYRDYLYDNGTLTAITEFSDNIPLYIEALGSMDIMDKFLTFPVEKSIALTTFDEVATMYSELRNSSSVLKEEMDKYQALADAEPDGSAKKAEYQKMADQYKNYSDFVINNINFRLTGFGSGGLSSNYPTKVRWERACGGKRGFNKLLEKANDAAASGDVFGIYPDYDFMYLSYSSMFDGVSKKKDISQMIDNRYASKQVYDSISRQYVSYFTLVISPESLDRLYSKFVKKYSKYDVTGISVSTMGSDLNSNFSEENPINRDDAQAYVETILLKMVKQDKYDVMLDIGNAYTLRYASHLLNVATDSSRLRFSSYSVPFVGMVLHGAVNYAGKPLNYSGMPEYDLLRSIESGASLYFILCYQNESYMKNDAILNDYFGVSYSSWYKDVVLSYNELNNAIGDLQDYIISDHKTVIGERVVDSEEEIANYKLLMDELVAMMDGQIDIAIDRANEKISRANNGYKTKIKLNIDRTKLMAQFEDILQLDFDGDAVTGNTKLNALVSAFVSEVDALIAEYQGYYSGDSDNAENNYVVTFDNLVYGISDVSLSEMLAVLEKQIKNFVADARKDVEDHNESEKDNPLKLFVTVDSEKIIETMATVCKMDSLALMALDGIKYTYVDYEEDGITVKAVNEIEATFGEHLTMIIDRNSIKRGDWTEEIDKDTGAIVGEEGRDLVIDSLKTDSLYLYTSKYSFLTDSSAFDENYIYTDYTSDRGNIVLVTYTKGNEQVKFLLNYNIYTVEVRLGNETYKLGKYDYIRIEG